MNIHICRIACWGPRLVSGKWPNSPQNWQQYFVKTTFSLSFYDSLTSLGKINMQKDEFFCMRYGLVSQYILYVTYIDNMYAVMHIMHLNCDLISYNYGTYLLSCILYTYCISTGSPD